MYDFFFVFDIPEHVFALYFHPISVFLYVQYNWMIGTCAAKISVVSNNQILWQSYLEIPTQKGKAGFTEEE